ncbi:MAG: CHRD domain-containing protein [Gemmatimonadaceae bacterium]
MRKTSTLAAVVLSTFAGAIACDDATDLDEMFFRANLSSDNVLGPIILPVGVVPAVGVASIIVNDGIMTVTIAVTDNLSSGVTGAQLRGPATELEDGLVVFDFGPAMAAAIAAGAVTGQLISVEYDLVTLPVTTTGELRITPADLINLLNSGLSYVNVTTVTNPNGELRGQVFRTDDNFDD